jgi:hypothetical protein
MKEIGEILIFIQRHQARKNPDFLKVFICYTIVFLYYDLILILLLF